MAKKPKKPKLPSGGAKMKKAELSPMLLGWTAEEKEKLKRAAVIDGRPFMTQFVKHHTLMAIEKILENNSRKA